MRRLVVTLIFTALILTACASPRQERHGPARLSVRLARPVEVRVAGEGPPLPEEGWGEPSGAQLAYIDALSLAASEASLAAIGVEFPRSSSGLQSIVLDPFQLDALLAHTGIQLDGSARNASIPLIGGSEVLSLRFCAPEEPVHVEIGRVRFGRLTITMDVGSSKDMVATEVTVTEDRPAALLRLRAEAPSGYLLLFVRQISVRR